MKNFMKSFFAEFNTATPVNCEEAAFSCENYACDHAEEDNNAVILSDAVFAASAFVIFIGIRLIGIIIPAIFGIIISLILCGKNTVTYCKKVS